MKRKVISAIAMVLTISAVSGCFISEKCYASEDREAIVCENNKFQKDINLAVKSQKAEYLRKLDNLSIVTEDRINDPSVYTTLDVINAFELSYKDFDYMLNKIWAVLRKQLPADEMNKLTKEEIEWIKEKEEAVQKQKENTDGTIHRINAAAIPYYMTKDRCYYLVRNYMK